MTEVAEEVKLEQLNNEQDDELPYQELPDYDFASHGTSCCILHKMEQIKLKNNSKYKIILLFY
jgi:hypothetical protein